MKVKQTATGKSTENVTDYNAQDRASSIARRSDPAADHAAPGNRYLPLAATWSA